LQEGGKSKGGGDHNRRPIHKGSHHPSPGIRGGGKKPKKKKGEKGELRGGGTRDEKGGHY